MPFGYACRKLEACRFAENGAECGGTGLWRLEWPVSNQLSGKRLKTLGGRLSIGPAKGSAAGVSAGRSWLTVKVRIGRVPNGSGGF